jgi:hypothetical protein
VFVILRVATAHETGSMDRFVIFTTIFDSTFFSIVAFSAVSVAVIFLDILKRKNICMIGQTDASISIRSDALSTNKIKNKISAISNK